MSYLNEKSVLNETTQLNETGDVEEQVWRKEGLDENDIFKRQEARKQKQMRDVSLRIQWMENAEDRLNREKYGAKGFEDMLALPQYSSERESDEDDHNEENQKAPEIPIFAIPSLPKHMNEKSMLGSPVAGSRGSGKAGLSCSTPKSANDVSMRSLRALDLSHVINTDHLDANKTNGEESDLQKTHTIQKMASSEGSTLQKTHTIHEDGSNERNLPTPEENDIADTDVRNPSNGGEQKRKAKKVGAQDRERRGANLSMSLMNSMMEDVPSSGANLLKHPLKKVRPETKSPQKPRVMGRLSTESDKEKTIEMGSIAEESSIAESMGSSYVDPVPENATAFSPVPEEEEPMEIANTTPKSTRRGSSFVTPHSLMERARGGTLFSTPVPPVVDAVTPKLNYQKQTVSSALKMKGAPNSCELLDVDRRCRSGPKKSVNVARESPKDNDDGNGKPEDVVIDDSKLNDEEMCDVTVEMPQNVEQAASGVELDMNGLTLHSANVSYNLDHDGLDDFHGDPNFEDERNESEDAGSSTRRTTRSRIGLLSDSIATVNSPGVDRRQTGKNYRNDTIPEDSWDSDEEVVSRRRNDVRNTVKIGLQLKKREIIQPDDATNGVRRSQRNRVKPVRSWLGEKPVYVNSPSGGKRLTGVTDVIIKDKRLCKYRTGDSF
ncbi:Protein CBR-HCP-4 [Caenorhabditis briggsae]|uniref:Protein CBR-HCP-4 n=1 Tax=Caenorhabditis briggsae TaxID=6238 RepID=A8XEQ4_CAEBR|nr:Protein CBR-HCP-4 [Caenorhabditis briggsae]CAP31022.2 Protein CBR-HCP-4 [Caenorhabditis briggsae]